MFKNCFLLFALLSYTTFLQAEQPTATINGPKVAQVGDIIILDASESDATFFAWHIDGSGISVPKSKVGEDAAKLADQLRKLGVGVQITSEDSNTSHLVLNDGKMLILASYKGTWRVVLATGNSEGVAIKEHKVVVKGDDTPSPPTTPPNTPEPPIVIPTPETTKYGLEKSSKEWLSTVPEAYRTQSTRIADVIDFFATQVDKGAYKSLEAAMQGFGQYLSAEQSAGRMNKSAWSKFGSNLEDAVSALKALGRISTAEQFAEAMREVAKGIR